MSHVVVRTESPLGPRLHVNPSLVFRPGGGWFVDGWQSPCQVLSFSANASDILALCDKVSAECADKNEEWEAL